MIRKMLILGAGGQLGREWCSFLEKSNNITWLSFDSSALDITDKDKVYTTLRDQRPDVVVNCAAYTAVDQAEDEREKAELINAKAVGFLAEACCSFDAGLIHYSTDYVFSGRRADRYRYPEGYPEEAPANPVNWYGQTKWEGEEAIRKAKIPHLIIRVSWLCGKYGQNFVKTMLRLGSERSGLDIVNDQWGSPTYASEVVRHSFELLVKEVSGTFHITSEGMITWFDFAREIFLLAGLTPSVRGVTSAQFSTKAQRPAFSKLNTRKIEAISGIKLVDWSEGLKKLLAELI